MQAERVRVLGALHSLPSKKQLAAEKWQEAHFLSNAENEKKIEDLVERKTTVARMRVEDAEMEIKKEQQDMRKIQNIELTTREPEKTCQQMLNDIGDSLRNIASSDDDEDAEDVNDEDTEVGKQSEDDKPGWEMRTISKMVQHWIGMLLQKQMMLDKLTQLR